MLSRSQPIRRRSKKMWCVAPSQMTRPPSKTKMISIERRSDLSGVRGGIETGTSKVKRPKSKSKKIVRALCDALDFYVIECDSGVGTIVAVAWQRGNFVGDVLAFHHLAKNGVLVVEPRCRSNGDEKLAAVGIGPGIGHGKLAGFGMLQRRMKFVGEFIAWPAHAGTVRAASLNHEIRNDAVEDEAVIERALFFLSGFFVGEFPGAFSETDKVFDSFGGFFFQQFDDDVALRGFENGIGASGTSHAISLEWVQKLSYTRRRRDATGGQEE